MKKALGKGIQAFIPEEFGILKQETFAELEIGQLKPNPNQPRMKFDSAAIEDLARSIKEAGILQPIMVVPDGDAYKILIGERRWRAAQLAGLRKVPVLIRNIPEKNQLEVSLIENLQREQLNPLEVALGYSRLTEDLGYTQEDVAEKVGKDRASVANYLRLLKLPEEIQEDLMTGAITMGHAKAILSMAEPEAQLALSRKIVKKGLSVREAEDLAGRAKEKAPRKKQKPDPNLSAVQEDLVRALGTKVEISGSAKTGAIKLFYFSLDELNRLYELLKGVRP
jgi:ParB family transcriptional regulator, chromosome partitioning protein